MESAYFQIRITFILTAIIGACLVPWLNIRLNPSPKTHNMSISFSYQGAGPELIEKDVTSRMESLLSRLDQLQTIESTSREGAGEIQLTFHKDADMEDTRLMLSALIRQIFPSLPKQVSYPRISYQSEYESYPTLMVYAAITAGKDFLALKQMLDREIILPISAIEGIHQVQITGLPEEEYYLKVKEEKIQLFNINYEEIRVAVNNWSSRQTLGLITESQNHHLTSLQYGSLPSVTANSNKDELLNLPLKNIQGRVIFIRDVAEIGVQQVRPTSYYRINGKNRVNIIIQSESKVNQIALAGKVKNKIEAQLKKISGQVELLLETDRSEYLKKELVVIFKRMTATLIILLGFMMVLFRSFKKLRLILFSFLVTLFLGSIVYYFAGVELHLYSLAGLTLSLGIVLDNLIVGVEHLQYHQDQRIFLALLAATLTTIGSFSIIFFISPEYREQLTDFAWIFFINLSMSLIVALFFLPAIVKPVNRKYKSSKRSLVRFNHLYQRYTRWSARRAWILFTFLVAAFGLPFFLLPTQWKKESKPAEIYNQIMDGPYGKKIHPFLSKYLGGTLKLFAKSKERFFFESSEKQETKLFVRAKMPFGGTLEQLNTIIADFETYLSHFPQIEQYQSQISSPTNSWIEIRFKEAFAEGVFPYQLKALLEIKAAQSGSGDFQVLGVGLGFNNEIHGGQLSTHLQLLGYNYDQLWMVAEKAREQLLQNVRIQKVFINPTKNYYVPAASFFELHFDERVTFFSDPSIWQKASKYWQEVNPDQGIIGTIKDDGVNIPIRMINGNIHKNHLWNIQHDLHRADSSHFLKNAIFSTLEKVKGSNNIVRYNQQYQLYLEYDFIGNYLLAEEIKAEALKAIAAQLPPGYHISDEGYNRWWKESTSSLSLIVAGSLVLIFLISAILFNSLRQAFIPLMVIPPAFIGIFLAVHFVDFRFDQGGFAAMLLVAGLSVNAGIFIINDYNNIRRRRPGLPSIAVYIKAFNAKIIPILLTVLSTVLGLLPFLLFDRHEPFWYSLAICTIAGVSVSLLGVVFLLPVFFGQGKNRKKIVESFKK